MDESELVKVFEESNKDYNTDTSQGLNHIMPVTTCTRSKYVGINRTDSSLPLYAD